MRRRPRRPKRQGPVEREGGRAVLLILLVVAMVAGMGYVAAYAAADGKLPTGTRIAGVDVGGRDPQAAARALSRGMAPTMRNALTLQVGDRSYQVPPARAGLSVDYLGSVERALGRRSWDPDHLWNYYTGGTDYPPVVTVDESKMGDLLDQLDHTLGTSPRNGNISLADGSIQVTQPRAGASIDHPQAVQAIRDAWADGQAVVQLPLRVTQPTVTAAQLQAAVTQLANPALAGAVTLRFDHSRLTLSPAQYAPMLTIAPKDGQLALGVVKSDLARLVVPSSHDTQPRDATVEVSAGAARVVRAHAGHRFDGRGVVTAFLAAVDATGDQRSVRVQGGATPAGFTTRDAKALGVRTPVATYAVAVPRHTGATLAAATAKLSGTLLQPGDSFSFDQVVGTVGGLADRLATAAWNAGFLAGLTDVTRTAPPTATSALPVGRDATVGAGADLQMRNDTSYGVLLTARVSGRQVVVNAWSTQQLTVTASVGTPYDPVPRSTQVDSSPTCRPSPGADGFTVDLTRTSTSMADPTQTRTDVVTTTYQPSNAVVCAPTPPPPAAPPA